jgi:acyl-CoA synthetase (AMP-forming)/AMP-acid ligase II
VPRNLRYPVEPAWWILARNVDRHANRRAIQVVDHASGEPGAAVSYGESMVWVQRLATRLQRLGVRRGDRVALYLPNSPALVASYFAACLLGATAVPSDSMASELELARQVDDAQASILLATGGNVPIARSVAERRGIPVLSDLQPDDPPLREPVAVSPHQDLALVIYTGGTTGEPKGAMLTHANLVANTLQFATWFQMSDDDETVVSALPLCHADGLAGAMNVELRHSRVRVATAQFVQ